MNEFINVIKRDPQEQIKLKDNSKKNIKLPPFYRIHLRYDTSIQNVILKEITNLMGTTILDKDIELKRISRTKYLENR